MIIKKQSHSVRTTMIDDQLIDSEHSVEIDVSKPQKRIDASARKINDYESNIIKTTKINLANIIPLHRINHKREGKELHFQPQRIDDNDDDRTAALTISSSSSYPREEERDDNNDVNTFKKQVSFDTEATMAMIIHHRDYTEKERAESWYSKIDFLRTFLEKKLTIGLMKEGDGKLKKRDRKKYCTRGLENQMPERAKMKANHKTEARLSVFAEQNLQLSRGIRDQEAIAKRYILTTKYCAVLARQMGIADEINLFNSEYMRKTITMTSPTASMNKHSSRQIMRCEKRSLQRSSTISLFPRSTRRIQEKKTTDGSTGTGSTSRREKRSLQHRSSIHFNSEYMKKAITMTPPTTAMNKHSSGHITRCERGSLQRSSTISLFPRSTRRVNEKKTVDVSTGSTSRKENRSLQHLSAIHFPLKWI